MKTGKQTEVLESKDFEHGQRCKATIDEKQVEGVITVKDNKVWICQDVKEGDERGRAEQFGKLFSWIIIMSATDSWHPGGQNVNELELLDEKVEPIKIPEPFAFQLNIGYEAMVHKGKIKVGCQAFTNAMIRDLASKLVD